MKLNTQRTLDQLKPVLQNPYSLGPDPVYFVFGDVSENEWVNLTIIQNGKIGREYPKTFGHYHNNQIKETYQVLTGEGIMQLQKKYFKDGNWIKERVEEVYLIQVKAGEKIIISPEYAHSWSNIGNFPLITLDDWKAGHAPADYEPLKKLHGLAYYLVEENGKPKAIPNPNYQQLPQPQWLTAKEFANLKK